MNTSGLSHVHDVQALLFLFLTLSLLSFLAHMSCYIEEPISHLLSVNKLNWKFGAHVYVLLFLSCLSHTVFLLGAFII